MIRHQFTFPALVALTAALAPVGHAQSVIKPAVRFRISAPPVTAAGAPFNFSVTVVDGNDTPLPGYRGTVHFTSSDPTATLPADALVVSAGGSNPIEVPTFAAILRSAGNQTITVTDRAADSLTGTSGTIVTGAAASTVRHFGMVAPPTAAIGTAFDSIIVALNDANGIVEGYTGPIHLTSTDPAASLAANVTFTNGVAIFEATLRSAGVQTISAADAGNPAVTGSSNQILVSTLSDPPAPLGATPSSGNTAEATFIFRFSDPRGVRDLDVSNILINQTLDGRRACYLAYSRPLNVLYLVDDDGLLDPARSGSLNGSGSVSNSQCTVSWGAAATASILPDILLLELKIAFPAGFGGNKVIYMAARDAAEANSGWQAQGVWRVPGAIQSTTTGVTEMTPLSGAGFGPSSFFFSFSDTRGFQDLGVVNILLNDSLDGRHACYLAYARPSNTLYLVNDNGDGLLPGQSMATAGTLANGQCTVAWDAGAVNGSRNNLNLNLRIGFRAGFAGKRIFYLAARDTAEGNNTGWQASGTWAIQ